MHCPAIDLGRGARDIRIATSILYAGVYTGCTCTCTCITGYRGYEAELSRADIQCIQFSTFFGCSGPKCYMYKYMYSLYSLHMYLVCRNDKCRACIMDQRCHTFSFGHYHQVPGASCSILYILVLSLVIFMQSLITWPARPAEPFWHATCIYIYISRQPASQPYFPAYAHTYIRGTRAKAGPGGAGDREARGSGGFLPSPAHFFTRLRIRGWLARY